MLNLQPGSTLPKELHPLIEALEGSRYLSTDHSGSFGFIWFPDAQRSEADAIQHDKMQILYSNNTIDEVKLPILVVNSGAGVHEFPIYPTTTPSLENNIFTIVLIDSVELEIKAVRKLEFNDTFTTLMTEDLHGLSNIDFDTYAAKHGILIDTFPTTEALLAGDVPAIQEFDKA